MQGPCEQKILKCIDINSHGFDCKQIYCTRTSMLCYNLDYLCIFNEYALAARSGICSTAKLDVDFYIDN